MKSCFKYHIILELLRYSVFIIFFIHCLRTVYVYLSYIPPKYYEIAIVIIAIISIFSMLKPKWFLFLFIAFIPLVSGIKTVGFLQSAPILSFIFSIFFMSWFVKKVFYTKELIEPNNQIGNHIDILSGIVLLSLFICFSRYPNEFNLYRIKFASTLGQIDSFWFIEASFIMLQGLFLFRILGFEIKDNNEWKTFIKCLYLHVLIISVFVMIQVFYNVPIKKMWGNSIHSPFMDIHAFGGYVVLLFFFFLNVISKNVKENAVSIIITLILFCCILLSGSTATLISMIVCGILFSFFKFGRRSLFISIGLSVIILVCINFFSDELKIDKRSFLKRYSDRSTIDGVITKLEGRFRSWDQAFGMMREFPITGSGIGTFYKISRYYHFSDKGQFSRHENAHNYYIQFAAELGVPALIIFFFILYMIYSNSIQYVTNNSEDKHIIIGLLFGLSAYLLTMMTSHHLIGSNHQFLFWFILFLLMHPFRLNNKFIFNNGKVIKTSGYIIFLIIIICVGHIFNYSSGKRIKGYEYGLFLLEKLEGKQVSWTMKQALIRNCSKTDVIGFSIYASPEQTEHRKQLVNIFINDVEIETVLFEKTGFRHYYYYIPGIKNKTFDLKIEVNETFNPYKLKLTNEIKKSRDQGVAITRLKNLEIIPKKNLKQIKYDTLF